MKNIKLVVERVADTFNRNWKLYENNKIVSAFFECRYSDYQYAITDDVVGVRFNNTEGIIPKKIKEKGNTDYLILEIPFGTEVPDGVVVVD